MRSTHAISSSTTSLCKSTTSNVISDDTYNYLPLSANTTTRNVEAQAIFYPDRCNARGHSPNSLVPHVPAYHLLRLFACTSRASALPALAVGKSLNDWASVRGILTSCLQCQMAIAISGEPGRVVTSSGRGDAGMLMPIVSVESVQSLASA